MKEILFSLSLIVFFASSSLGGEEGELKIAIASQGKTTEAQVAQRAARSPYFLLFGKDGKLQEVVENPYKDLGRRAGTEAAAFLAQKEATLVVAGVFGNKMAAALESKAIRYVEFTGTVGEAIKKALDQGANKPD